jgi:hypothetical protein
MNEDDEEREKKGVDDLSLYTTDLHDLIVLI